MCQGPLPAIEAKILDTTLLAQGALYQLFNATQQVISQANYHSAQLRAFQWSVFKREENGL